MTDHNLIIIASLWVAKDILPWNIISVKSDEELEREFESKEGVATIPTVSLVPGLIVSEWYVDRQKGLAVHNPDASTQYISGDCKDKLGVILEFMYAYLLFNSYVFFLVNFNIKNKVYLTILICIQLYLHLNFTI